MKKTENLPHLNESFHLWARMKGSNILGENLFQEKPDQLPRGVHSTGTWGLSRKEKCIPIKSCLICGTAPLTSASEMDAKLLTSQKDKFKQKSPGQLLHKSFNKKNPADGRHQLSRPMRIVEPIQI